MNLKESAFALARHLHDENIIKIDDLDRKAFILQMVFQMSA